MSKALELELLMCQEAARGCERWEREFSAAAGLCMPWYECRGQGTTCRSQLSPSTMWGSNSKHLYPLSSLAAPQSLFSVNSNSASC